MALNAYIQQVQQLLHDPAAQNWSTSQLTGYINTARNRVAQDTYCLRQIVPNFALTAGVENYTIAAVTSQLGLSVIDVMGIDLYYSATNRQSLFYFPWTVFNARYRAWTGTQQRPEAFTRMGGLQVYFGPNPDQAYNTDWIVSCNPQALVTDATVEQIPAPFTDCIQFFAAYLAKFQEQALGEAAIFKNEYVSWLRRVQAAFMRRVVQDPYDAG